ncbi:MAG: nucleotide exchange factor GrpE [Saprospiraceae bacterium]|nr:nucleotide exchange factor GrpE [Saprospiraceae bacterium]
MTKNKDHSPEETMDQDQDMLHEDNFTHPHDEQPQDTVSSTSGTGGESEDLKDKYLRLFAEFDNFKKRNIRERLDLMKSASQDMMTAILPVLDDFDRAQKNAEAQERTDDPVLEGLLLVHSKLSGILKQKGLEDMDPVGEDFDPELHEAITEIPAPSPELKGKVIDTIEKGYLLNDKIIRYAKVVVGS